jgi:hypothetical protein
MDVKDGLMMTTVDPSGIIMKNATGVETIKIDGANGNVGIGISNPVAGLHVNNGAKIVVQDSVDGGDTRGLQMWSPGDPNWAIYMGSSGSGKSFDASFACSGQNYTLHAIRIRTNSAESQGFLYENAENECLFSVRGNDGMTWFSGNVGIGKIGPTEKLDVTGNIKASGTITSGGNVGIGIASPGYPLDVQGQVTDTLNSPGVHYILDDITKVVGVAGRLVLPEGPTTTPYISIRTSHGVACPYIYAYSDERIKTEITDIDDGKALMQINQLESKEYHYIDPERRRPMKTIGFIAQEVKEIIPNAVGLITQFITDEMRRILEPQWNSNVLTIPYLDMSPENLTGKCKFYVSDDAEGKDEKCIEIDCEKDADGNKTNVFKFEKEYAHVFFHGKEVNDFHTIDKNQIFALHHSAIQELSRKNDTLVAENTNLKNEISLIKQHLGI